MMKIKRNKYSHLNTQYFLERYSMPIYRYRGISLLLVLFFYIISQKGQEQKIETCLAISKWNCYITTAFNFKMYELFWQTKYCILFLFHKRWKNGLHQIYQVSALATNPVASALKCHSFSCSFSILALGFGCFSSQSE